jgi:hypothetical protein
MVIIEAAIPLLYFFHEINLLASNTAAILGALTILRVNFLEFLAMRVFKFFIMSVGSFDVSLVLSAVFSSVC